MPAQYDAIKQTMLNRGMASKDAKRSAAKIFISRGKGFGDRSGRAKRLSADRKSSR